MWNYAEAFERYPTKTENAILSNEDSSLWAVHTLGSVLVNSSLFQHLPVMVVRQRNIQVCECVCVGVCSRGLQIILNPSYQSYHSPHTVVLWISLLYPRMYHTRKNNVLCPHTRSVRQPDRHHRQLEKAYTYLPTLFVGSSSSSSPRNAASLIESTALSHELAPWC